MKKNKQNDARQKNFNNGIKVDVLLYEMFNLTQIRFVGSNLYKPYNGWGEATKDELFDMLTVLKNEKAGKVLEFVVEGDEWVIDQLKDYSSDYACGLHFDDAIDFLQANGFTYSVVCEEDAALM